MLTKSKHDIEHDELWGSHYRFFTKMFAEYFSRIHPPEIGVLMSAVLNLINVMEVFFVLCVFEKVDVFVLLKREHKESGIVSALDKRNSYEANEWYHERSWL